MSITALNCKYRMYLFRKGIIKEPFRMDGMSRDAVKTLHTLDRLCCMLCVSELRFGLSLDHMSKNGEHNGTKDFFPLQVSQLMTWTNLWVWYFVFQPNVWWLIDSISSKARHWVLFMSVAKKQMSVTTLFTLYILLGNMCVCVCVQKNQLSLTDSSSHNTWTATFILTFTPFILT